MEATPCSDIPTVYILLFCACNVDVNTALYQTICHLTKFETSIIFIVLVVMHIILMQHNIHPAFVMTTQVTRMSHAHN